MEIQTTYTYATFESYYWQKNYVTKKKQQRNCIGGVSTKERYANTSMNIQFSHL